MSAAANKTDALALWAAGITLLVWSSSYPAIAYSLRAFTPGELVLLRMLVASLCFLPPVLLGWIKLPPRRDWPAVIMLGLIGHLAYQLFLGYSMTRISAGAAAVVIAMAPAVTSALAVLRLKESLSASMIAGLLVAFIGSMLVTIGNGQTVVFDPMALLVFVAVLCCSIFFVWQKPLLARTSPLGFSAATFFVATIGLLPFGLGLPVKLFNVPATQIYTVVYLGLVCTSIGIVSWSVALSRAPASRITSFLYLQPVGACLIAWIWLHEAPGWITVAGGALAIGGVLLTTMNITRLRRFLQRGRVPAATCSMTMAANDEPVS